MLQEDHRGAVSSCSEVSKRILGRAGPSTLGVLDSPAHDVPMKTVDTKEWNGEFDFDEERGLHTTLAGVTLLCDQENAELSHALAATNHSAGKSDVRRVSEPSRLGRLVSVKSICSVFDPHKVRNCTDGPGLSKEAEYRDLHYIFIFVYLNRRGALFKE